MTAYPTSLRSTFVGFDNIFEILDKGLEAEKYPPHNLVTIDQDWSVIELALAGYTEEDIKIELDKSVLTITGEPIYQDRKYVYQGIAFRKFKKQFRLAEHVEVKEAILGDGLLRIHLEKVVPEAQKPKVIALKK